MTNIKDALEGLIEAVVRDADEPGGRGISGYTSARLSDARQALSQLTANPDRERVARIIDPEAMRAKIVDAMGNLRVYKNRDEEYVIDDDSVSDVADAILATGLVAGEAERPLGDVFNELVRRMNFDGMDPRTFTLGELERAIDGAEFPK